MSMSRMLATCAQNINPACVSYHSSGGMQIIRNSMLLSWPQRNPEEGAIYLQLENNKYIMAKYPI